ncbi:haloacid dehalogenase superfamily, subfamily IA, variant 3 with third motif having DD or ED [Cohaesibacter sp. ES.047]|uniref:HAD family hydrolase n=1 Tax=Cohaesibacter sp. ES.047 TaxID=1798205 RepID=UPI000BB95A17|nr:HAD family phosphatase [Cohaesibacter sp. ES.047]SNY92042.1 haloacid dehalogenase superfamily, subfamily IA, variant 3 with third motif having DD or ED [Cohaesibacter sp. ES.047]
MLVIFDCDGTLIDSEILWARASVEIFQEEELEIGLEDYNSTYAGMTNEEIIQQIEAELERSLPHDLTDRINDLAMRRIDKLEAIEGAQEMLDQLDYARCMCSNSSSEMLEANLRRTGLWDRFRPYIYSAIEVGTKAPKPDPNVFLHAATTLDVDPAECFVVEDSFHGVQAASNAGMRVIGFIGAGHTYLGHGEHLMDAGAETVVRRLAELPATIDALSSWKPE